MLTKIYEFLGSFSVGFARLLARTSYMLMAIKAMIVTAISVGIGSTLYAFVVRIINELFVYVLDIVSGSFNDAIPTLSYEFVGLGAYFFDALRLGEAFAIVMTAVIVSWLLAFIPFVGKH